MPGPFAAVSEEQTLNDSFNRLFQAIFDIFEDISLLGDEWGEPWGTLLPVFVALGTALAVVGGVRYVFWHMQEKIKPFFFVALLIVGAVSYVAIRDTDLANDPTESAPGSPAGD